MGGLSAGLRSIARATVIAACLVTVVGVTAQARAPKPDFFGQEVWGWVVARNPSTTQYTPSAKDRGNSSGGTNSVHRVAKGEYEVTFRGLGTGGGALIHISPLSTSARQCVIDSLGESGSD